MDRINISALNDLIAIYFGQDYDLFDDSEDIEPKIDAFIAGSHKGLQHAVIDDIDLFLKECDDLESDFRAHYRDTFVPESWAGLRQLAIDAKTGKTANPRNNAGKSITTALVPGLPQN